MVQNSKLCGKARSQIIKEKSKMKLHSIHVLTYQPLYKKLFHLENKNYQTTGIRRFFEYVKRYINHVEMKFIETQ